MKKLPPEVLLRYAALTLAVPALLLGIASLPWRSERPEEPPRLTRAACEAGPIVAGAGAATFELPGDAPIAGFARLRWQSKGVLDPVGVRAVVLGAPGCQLALVSAEILVVTDALDAAVRARVQDLGLHGVVLAATHTHASPGGYWDNIFGEWVGTAPYDARMEEVVTRGIADAIRRAYAAVGPAELALGRTTAGELVKNRGGGPKDARLTVVRLARPGGEPLAELAFFPAHATTLGNANRRISGDWPGRFLRAGDRGLRLFFQGALGDQSASLPDSAATPSLYGDAFSRRVEALPTAAVRDPALAFVTADVVLPAPEPGVLPPLLRSAARNLTYGALPAHAQLFALRLGSTVLVFVPAEPVADVAEAWRAEAGAGTEIVSLAGGYAGYVESPTAMEERTGEAARTYYGPELAARLGHAIAAAAEAVRRDALPEEAPLDELGATGSGGGAR